VRHRTFIFSNYYRYREPVLIFATNPLEATGLPVFAAGR
jgi:hypothetical protein